MHISFMSRILFSFPSFGFCNYFLKDFIHNFVKIATSEPTMAKESNWVYHILKHLKWPFVTASLKKFFIADFGVSWTLSLEDSSLTAFVFASSTCTFVYIFLTSSGITNSSSSN